MSLIDPAIHAGFLKCATNNGWPDRQNYWFSFRKGEKAQNSTEDSEFGSRFFDLWCETGQTSVHRARFLDELVALIPEGVAHFGKKLDRYSTPSPDSKGREPVTLHFTDSTTATHSALLAADGIKSAVRPLLLGPHHPAAHAVFTGKYAYRGLIPMPSARQLLGAELAENSQMYLGRGGHILTFPIEKGETMNVVAFGTKADGKWGPEEPWVKPLDREAMYADFEGWVGATKKILTLMQKPDIWALFNHLPAPYYNKGRVCLLGDAAHASTPHNGAGAGQAIEDALVMSRVLALVYKSEDIERAFAAFDAVRRPRSQKQVEVAREGGLLYDLQLPGVEDDWAKVKRILAERQRWIWERDLEADVREVERVFREGSETARL